MAGKIARQIQKENRERMKLGKTAMNWNRKTVIATGGKRKSKKSKGKLKLFG